MNRGIFTLKFAGLRDWLFPNRGLEFRQGGSSMSRPFFFLRPVLCAPFLLADSLPRKDRHNLPQRAKYFANHHAKVWLSVRSKISYVGFVAASHRVPITANEIRAEGYLRGPRKFRRSLRIEPLCRKLDSSGPDALDGDASITRFVAIFVF
ncbi:MAG: hypothetical protein ACYDCE_15835 [Candidatus Acidiferrales bacterium]